MEPPAEPQTIEALTHRVAKLERINAALMAHVERTMDQQGGAYSLFQRRDLRAAALRRLGPADGDAGKSLVQVHRAVLLAIGRSAAARRSRRDDGPMNRPGLWMEPPAEPQTIEALTHRVAKLERINVKVWFRCIERYCSP
jgi:hypothetical protein